MALAGAIARMRCLMTPCAHVLAQTIRANIKYALRSNWANGAFCARSSRPPSRLMTANALRSNRKNYRETIVTDSVRADRFRNRPHALERAAVFAKQMHVPDAEARVDALSLDRRRFAGAFDLNHAFVGQT